MDFSLILNVSDYIDSFKVVEETYRMFSLEKVSKNLDKSAKSLKTCKSILRICLQNGKRSSLSSAKYQMLKKIKHKNTIAK